MLDGFARRAVDEVCKGRVRFILDLVAKLSSHLNADCACDHVE